MAPTLEPGDTVLVDPRAYRGRLPRPGDVVVSRHPFKTDVRQVKRVAACDGRALTLRGDNPAESTDSRTQGTTPIGLVLGRVTGRVRRRADARS